jgi:hypothetical protein
VYRHFSTYGPSEIQTCPHAQLPVKMSSVAVRKKEIVKFREG